MNALLLSVLFPLLLADGPAEPAVFSPFHEAGGVTVEISRTGDKAAPWIRGTAEIDAPAADVAAVLRDYAAYKKTFEPIIKKLKVLDVTNGRTRMHVVWHFPWPLRSRDTIVGYEMKDLEDGAFLLSWKDDPHEGDPAEGVRIKAVAGTTRVTPIDATRCRIVYTYLGDLGGDFGKSSNEKAWKGEPGLYVEAIRNRLPPASTP